MIIYGADYNPEQWSKDVWLEDMTLMKECKVNMVNLNIFGWALLEPSEGVYDFSMLDEMMDLLYENKISVDLATATAAQPAWLSMKYEDVLPKDKHMNTVWHGSRQTYCPNSSHYRLRAKLLVEAIVKRYHKHPALKMWHVNNEYSDHTSICYCDTCAEKFRVWLKGKYSLEEVNERWGTAFWSQRYYSFSHIIPPRHTAADPNPGLVLDYKRFMSESTYELFLMEYDIIKAYTPDMTVTSNFMGNDNKPLDYYKWAKKMDLVSWDSYPDPLDSRAYMKNALTHDLMRSYKKQAFVLMEQAPDQVNWRSKNPNKEPNEMILYSMQALAHGGKGVMFFQWRQSLKGAEKFHSGMVPHNGTETKTYREVKALGHILSSMKEDDFKASVAIYFDYDNWWALEYEPGPSADMKYMDIVRDYYAYFYDNNIPVDFVFNGETLEDYDYVLVPNAYMLHDEGVFKDYVKKGGQLIMGAFSGIVDESDTVFSKGYMSSLSDVFGIKVLGYHVLKETKSNLLGHYSWKDEVKVLTADLLFDDDVLITKNSTGHGNAYYIGGRFDDYSKVLDEIIKIKGYDSDEGVSVRVGKKYVYLLNFTGLHKSLDFEGINYKLQPYGYKIIHL
ncbi:beta-galactosidase [Acidaminobacter sp. JC074]|uniref:beta-galactosidase n=1 Tax=Acidaminobacter sp. JC074 TaxID=2530199 RepID=UPI001F0D7749|nr:beta-galactosidase [Acidaminobacter sp. JC074]MCH4889801.1 beta-galactosidase [Acidaminobacter sp. JC074]